MDRKLDTQAIIRNRNQPSAFFVRQPGDPVSPDGGVPVFEPPPQTDTALESYNQQNNIAPEVQPDAEMVLPVIPPTETPTETVPDVTVETQTTATPEYNPNAPKQADARTEAVKTSIAAPYLAQIEANRKKAEVLRTMPVTDQDGRTKSGLTAFLQSLAQNPQLRNIRSWGDLAKSVTYSTAAGIGGAVDKTWNERQKRDVEIAKLEENNQRLQKQAEADLKLAGQESVINARARTQDRQDDVFENRVNEQKYKKVQDEKKEVLAPIFKRGFFYADSASPEELARLEAAGIVLDDFDTTKTAYNDEGGIRKVWDIRKREYVPAKGDEPDEPLVPVEIDGVRINLKPRDYANYKASEQATNYKTQIQNDDNDAEHDENVRKFKVEKGEIQGKIDGNTRTGNMLYRQNEEANEEIRKANEQLAPLMADPAENREAISAAQRRIDKAENLIQSNKREIAKLEGDNSSLITRRDLLPEPIRRKKIAPYSGAVQTQKYTADEIRLRVKNSNPKATEEELKKLFNDGIQKVKNAGAFKE